MKVTEEFFGNAGGVKNTKDALIRIQAGRLGKMDEKKLTDDDYQMITVEDFYELAPSLKV